MPRLLINTGGPQILAMELKPGSNFFGRNKDNDIPIDHPTLSDRHCEIILENNAILIRDLESTNGTMIEGQLITEAALEPGQTLQAGAVKLQIEQGPAIRITTPRSVAPVMSGAIPLQAGHRTPQVKPPPIANKNFFSLMPAAFVFPFKRDGLMLLIGGAAVYLVQHLLGSIIGVAAGGYLVAYMQQIIVTSAEGSDSLPPWPDFSDIWQDILTPFLQITGIGLICFAPAILLKTFGPADIQHLAYPLQILGFLYFPMALLAVAIHDRLLAANPVTVLAAIFRVPGPYVAAVLVFMVILVLESASEFLLGLISIPIAPFLLMGFVAFYFLTVEMRVLGLVYYCYRDRLLWFR